MVSSIPIVVAIVAVREQADTDDVKITIGSRGFVRLSVEDLSIRRSYRIASGLEEDSAINSDEFYLNVHFERPSFLDKTMMEQR